jgi:hypothetical protein
MDSSISSAVPNLDLTMQPMSSRFIHVFQRPVNLAANESSFNDTADVIECMSNALLWCRPAYQRAPDHESSNYQPACPCFSYDKTQETNLPLLTALTSLSVHQWHNRRNQESYLILSTSLPYVAQPTRSVLTLHANHPLSILLRPRSQ